MGSLVPGWNSVGNLPPIDLRSSYDDDEEEPKGYFAKLQKTRSLRRTSTDVGGAPDLSRRSAPLSPGSWSPRAHDSLFGQPSSPVEMRRTTESNDGFEVGSAPTAGADLAKYKTSKGRDNYRWWKKLSSGYLNEMYEDEHTAQDKSKGFVPQYTVTGQAFNYRVEKPESEPADNSNVELDDDLHLQRDDEGKDPQPSASA